MRYVPAFITAIIITIVISLIHPVYAVNQFSICVKKNGLMYVIGEGFQKADCRQNDKIITFSVIGSTGATGPTGPTGPQGPTGPTGPVGISEYEQISVSGSEDIHTKTLVATCPEGKVVVGGGFSSSTYSISVKENAPAGPTGWTATVNKSAAGAWTLTVTAICVKMQ